MKFKALRFYSTEELREMNGKDIPAELLPVIEKMPPVPRSHAEELIGLAEVLAKKREAEAKAAQLEKERLQKLEEERRKAEEAERVRKAWEEEHQRLLNIYADLDFSKPDLSVSEIVVMANENGFCSKHGEPPITYKKVWLLSRNGRKTAVFSLMFCPICKRLYIKQSLMDNYRKSFGSQRAPYHILEEK